MVLATVWFSENTKSVFILISNSRGSPQRFRQGLDQKSIQTLSIIRNVRKPWNKHRELEIIMKTDSNFSANPRA